MSSKGFYQFWGAITSYPDAKQRAQRVLHQISKYHPRAINILELGVGIGTVLRNFPKRFCLSGIDILPDSVRVCKRRIPRGKFWVSSMHNFRTWRRFDVIFCVFDSINFLKSFSQWKSTFRKVHHHLDKGGLFVFDMYTPRVLHDYIGISSMEPFSMGYTYSRSIIKGDSLTWDYWVFERKSGIKLKHTFNLHKFLFSERIFSVSIVERELTLSFYIIEKKYFDRKRRILFVCRKK